MSKIRKIITTLLMITLVLPGTSITKASSIAEGTDVVPSTNVWESFSICTREDGGVWEDALKGIISEECPNGQIKGVHYATEGYITTTNYSSSSFNFYVKNSGWDGEYNPITGDLVADNPWGMTAKMNIPVENERNYKVSFKIKSTLANEFTTIKHLKFIITDALMGTGVELISTEGCTTGGYITLDSSNDGWHTVIANFKIGNSKNFKGDSINFTFALGAMTFSYPEEIGQSGYLYLRDFQVIAGETVEETSTDIDVESSDGTWGSYFGYNSGWYEGAEGELVSNTSSGWTANLLMLGWGGCWGGQVYQDTGRGYGNISIDKGKEYVLSFDIKSSNCDKWVYVLIGEGTSPAYSTWIKLSRGVTQNFSETFTAKTDASRIYFGIGGEFGDRTGVDTDAEIRYALVDNMSELTDVDPTAATQITCNNFSLISKDDVTEESTTQISLTEVSTPIISINGNSATISWDSTEEQKKIGQKYNLYLDGNIVYAGIDSGSYTINNLKEGTHTFKVTSVLNGDMSVGKEIAFNIASIETNIDPISMKKLDKVTIKKVNKKVLSAKKISLWVKKIDGATGYEVAVYKSKKKANKDKKAIVTANSTKIKIVVKSNKLANKKKLFVKVRAYGDVNGTKVYGQWSKVKKVTIK